MTLIEFLELLRRRSGLLAALAILGGVLTAIWAMTLPPLYEASATMYVLTDSENAQTLTQNDLNIGSMITNDTVQIINSSRVAKEVAETLGKDNLNGYSISTTSGGGTRVIVLTVESPDQDQVAEVANAYVATTSRVAEEIMGVEAVNVVDEATRPAASSGPPRLRYILGGVAVGAMIGIALILIIDLLDTRVRSSEVAEEIAGAVVVGRFPKIERS